MKLKCHYKQAIKKCWTVSICHFQATLSFKLNPEELETKITMEGINKEISIESFREQKLIGFISHSDRKVGETQKAYNTGTGVIPTERGNALTKRKQWLSNLGEKQSNRP